MSSTLFGYYGIGLRALGAAQTGLSVAGDNIANVNTPGYSRRRIELRSGLPVEVKGGFLDDGVQVARIRRAEDRFLAFSLRRERGGLGREEQRLAELRTLESAYGTLDGETIQSALDAYGSGFRALAADPENRAARVSALAAADRLATRIRETYDRLGAQRDGQDVTVGSTVDEINRLAVELARVNRELAANEAGVRELPALRDQRDGIVDRLAELTGGVVETAENGKLRFALPDGPTLVTGDRALTLSTTADADGRLRVLGADGTDLTDRLRGGRLGATLEVRDETIAGQLDELDKLARVLANVANAATAASTDLAGNPGGPLFEIGVAPGTPGAAGALRVSQALLDDPDLLAISRDGSVGDGSGALELAEIPTRDFVRLGGSPTEFVAGLLSRLGNAVVEADVAADVAGEVVADLGGRLEATRGVSLDEEALELVRYQRAYESAARFIAVLNDVTEIAVRLGS